MIVGFSVIVGLNSKSQKNTESENKNPISYVASTNQNEDSAPNSENNVNENPQNQEDENQFYNQRSFEIGGANFELTKENIKIKNIVVQDIKDYYIGCITASTCTRVTLIDIETNETLDVVYPQSAPFSDGSGVCYEKSNVNFILGNSSINAEINRSIGSIESVDGKPFCRESDEIKNFNRVSIGG